MKKEEHYSCMLDSGREYSFEPTIRAYDQRLLLVIATRKHNISSKCIFKNERGYISHQLRALFDIAIPSDKKAGYAVTKNCNCDCSHGQEQNSLNPLESYIIIPPATVAYIQSNENPFPLAGRTSTEIHRKDSLHPLNSFLLLLSYSTYPAEQNA